MEELDPETEMWCRQIESLSQYETRLVVPDTPGAVGIWAETFVQYTSSFPVQMMTTQGWEFSEELSPYLMEQRVGPPDECCDLLRRAEIALGFDEEPTALYDRANSKLRAYLNRNVMVATRVDSQMFCIARTRGSYPVVDLNTITNECGLNMLIALFFLHRPNRVLFVYYVDREEWVRYAYDGEELSTHPMTTTPEIERNKRFAACGLKEIKSLAEENRISYEIGMVVRSLVV